MTDEEGDLSADGWKTYWRTVALTPFQVAEIDRLNHLSICARIDGSMQATLDTMELQMLGIQG